MGNVNLTQQSTEERIETPVVRHRVFEGKILTVDHDEILDAGGRPARREIVRHRGGAAILVVQDGAVLLVRQYRYAYGEFLWEIPAGKLEEGETDAAAAAMRELEEETGLRALECKYLGEIYPTPGYCDERIRLFAVTKTQPGQINPDEGEYLDVAWMPLSVALAKISDNTLKDSKTVIAIMRYASGLV